MQFEIAELKNIQDDLNALPQESIANDVKKLIDRLIAVAIVQQKTIEQIGQAIRQS